MSEGEKETVQRRGKHRQVKGDSRATEGCNASRLLRNAMDDYSSSATRE